MLVHRIVTVHKVKLRSMMFFQQKRWYKGQICAMVAACHAGGHIFFGGELVSDPLKARPTKLFHTWAWWTTTCDKESGVLQVTSQLTQC